MDKMAFAWEVVEVVDILMEVGSMAVESWVVLESEWVVVEERQAEELHIRNNTMNLVEPENYNTDKYGVVTWISHQ